VQGRLHGAGRYVEPLAVRGYGVRPLGLAPRAPGRGARAARRAHRVQRSPGDSIEKHKDWLGEVGALRDVSDLEAKRKEYAALFGNYGEKSWTTKDIYSIVGEIEQLWPDEETAKRELRGFYSLGHRINNQKLHTTSLAINNAAKVHRFDEDGQPIIRLSASPTDEERPMIRALYGALFTYGRITRLLISETGRDLDAFDTFYSGQLDLLYKLAPSKRGQIRRNDQCPCGSGKKYKTCHGA
jgi:hypothetical protein